MHIYIIHVPMHIYIIMHIIIMHYAYIYDSQSMQLSRWPLSKSGNRSLFSRDRRTSKFTNSQRPRLNRHAFFTDFQSLKMGTSSPPPPPPPHTHTQTQLSQTAAKALADIGELSPQSPRALATIMDLCIYTQVHGYYTCSRPVVKLLLGAIRKPDLAPERK